MDPNVDRFQDISLNQASGLGAFIWTSWLTLSFSQWLALSPPAMVKATLNLDDATIAKLSKTKLVVV